MLARPLVVLSMLLAFPATAQEPKRLSTHHDWEAYVYGSGKEKICYIASSPKSHKPKGINRDPAFFQVAHFPGRSLKGEIHVEVGYPLKPNSRPRARVKVKKKRQDFRFFVKDSSAWVVDQKNAPVVEAMKAGSTMVFTATSARGTVVSDSYSLKGFTAAYKAITKACRLLTRRPALVGLPRPRTGAGARRSGAFRVPRFPGLSLALCAGRTAGSTR